MIKGIDYEVLLVALSCFFYEMRFIFESGTGLHSNITLLQKT